MLRETSRGCDDAGTEIGYAASLPDCTKELHVFEQRLVRKSANLLEYAPSDEYCAVSKYQARPLDDTGTPGVEREQNVFFVEAETKASAGDPWTLQRFSDRLEAAVRECSIGVKEHQDFARGVVSSRVHLMGSTGRCADDSGPALRYVDGFVGRTSVTDDDFPRAAL